MTSDEAPNPSAKIIGPCYTTTSLARTHRWTEAKVAEAGETLQLLVLETDEEPRYTPHSSSTMVALWTG